MTSLYKLEGTDMISIKISKGQKKLTLSQHQHLKRREDTDGSVILTFQDVLGNVKCNLPFGILFPDYKPGGL